MFAHHVRPVACLDNGCLLPGSGNSQGLECEADWPGRVVTVEGSFKPLLLLASAMPTTSLAGTEFICNRQCERWPAEMNRGKHFSDAGLVAVNKMLVVRVASATEAWMAAFSS